jgi:hypothetical protein
MKRITQIPIAIMAALLFFVAFCSPPMRVVADEKVSPVFEVGGQVDESQLGYLPLMRQSGMTWMKVQLVAEEGTPDISWILRDWARPNRLKLMVALVGNRSLASDPNYANTYAAIAAGIARHGADAIEVWNEPNLGREWPGTNPYTYMHLLVKAYAAIKKANSRTLVISAGVAAYADTRECGPDVCGSPLFYRGMQVAAVLYRTRLCQR